MHINTTPAIAPRLSVWVSLSLPPDTLCVPPEALKQSDIESDPAGEEKPTGHATLSVAAVAALA